MAFLRRTESQQKKQAAAVAITTSIIDPLDTISAKPIVFRGRPIFSTERIQAEVRTTTT